MNVEKLIELIMENPETIPMLIPEMVNKYKPIIYSIGEEIHNILKDYADNTEYFKTNAKIKKQTFDAYIDAGFNENQAMAFMINDNIRLMDNIKSQILKISTQK